MIASDEQLMEAVRKDNLDKLNELFDRYQKRLYNYFLKSTLSVEDSGDLTQNVFIRVMKYRKSYKPGSRFELWIFQIARNQLKDHFRKMKIYQEQFSAVEAMPEQPSEDDEHQVEQEQKLLKAMRRLPNDKRELLVLSKFQGLKYEQIAELKSSSVAAIKVQVHRTIKQLRTLYFEEND